MGHVTGLTPYTVHSYPLVCVCLRLRLLPIKKVTVSKKSTFKFVFVKKISYLYFILIPHSDGRSNTKSIRNSYMFFLHKYPSYVCVRM